MDGKTRRAFLSVINKWLMGEKNMPWKLEL